jgi:hypothetical protein
MHSMHAPPRRGKGRGKHTLLKRWTRRRRRDVGRRTDAYPSPSCYTSPSSNPSQAVQPRSPSASLRASPSCTSASPSSDEGGPHSRDTSRVSKRFRQTHRQTDRQTGSALLFKQYTKHFCVALLRDRAALIVLSSRAPAAHTSRQQALRGDCTRRPTGRERKKCTQAISHLA